ncbi:MAG: SDR family NAD(P)-dependent oxidoreductase [Rhodospirillales bacterium]
MSDRILVTGGSGFLGSALVRRLVGEGHDVIVLDNGSRGSLRRLQDVIDRVTYVEGDIRDPEAVMNATRGCDTVFHLAFINGTRFFYEKPDQVLDVGVKGALTTLEAALACNTSTYVLASSSEIYQEPTRIPTPEDERAIIPDVTNPRYSYAGGKLISELLSINGFRNSATRDMIFRPHNVVGPDMGFEHVIPEFMMKLHASTDGWAKDSATLAIQGSGEETRAFCYVEDAVDELMVMYEHGRKGEIYHIGMDNEISILDLIRRMGQVLGIEVTVATGEARAGGTSRRCPDISKIRQLGYQRNDRFDEGLDHTVAWYRDFLTRNQTPIYSV